MSAGDDLAALRPVVEALESLGVEYYIGGSVASSLHGRARATIDIDIVAHLEAQHVEPLIAALGEEYYLDAGAMGRAIGCKGSFNLIHLATMYKVDLFVMRDRPYDQVARRRVVRERLSEEAPLECPIAAAEDVILSKLGWYRDGGMSSERQWLDVIGVIQVQRDHLDREYLRRWAADLGVADLLARAWQAAQQPPS